MEPMLLKPVGKDYLWGGTRLKTEFYKELPENPLAETWECSVHKNGPSMVSSGRYKGMNLKDVLEMHPDYLGERVGDTLPILIKLIDAEKDLSVQVHPDDEYAWVHEGQKGKTEMWYVLDAKPGAQLIHGFRHDVYPEQLRKAIQNGNLSKHLQKVPVKKGDVFFISPGTVHAIGAGVLIAEIQENSDVTYRIYDYDRIDRDGKKRELHFEKAVEILNMKAEDIVKQKPRTIHYYPGCSREVLGRCRYFETERIQVSMGFSFTVTNNSCQVLLCIDGRGGIETEGNRRPLRFMKGDCIFLPARLGRCHVLGNSTLLKIRN